MYAWLRRALWGRSRQPALQPGVQFASWPGGAILAGVLKSLFFYMEKRGVWNRAALIGPFQPVKPGQTWSNHFSVRPSVVGPVMNRCKSLSPNWLGMIDWRGDSESGKTQSNPVKPKCSCRGNDAKADFMAKIFWPMGLYQFDQMLPREGGCLQMTENICC